ncbi:MAG: AAA family ATPase [bacterium]
MTLSQIAVSYRDKYNFSVFPVKIKYKPDGIKFDKKPAVTWGPFITRLPTDEEICSGFSRTGVNAIGLATGKVSGVTVLDWDSKEEPPHKSPIMVQTISGGRHIYFKYKAGVGNTVRLGGKTLDVRGEGGFVVIPPSEFEGHSYKWLIDGNLSDLIKDLPEFPDLSDHNRKIELFNPPLDVQDHLNVAIGERDDKLYRFACSLLQKHSPDDAWLLLLGVARGYEGYGQSMTESDVKSKYNNAYKFLEPQGKLYKERTISSAANQSGTATTAKTDITIDFAPKLLSELIKEDYQIDWLWEGYIAKGHITLLSALWKAGKTTLIAELFRNMQVEGSLAGQKTNKCRVLYLSEEREAQWVERREEKKLSLPIYILCNPLKRKLKPDEWVKWVEKAADYCVANDLSLAVIDTMTTFSSVTDENDSSQVNASLLPLNYFREKNIAVLLVHHFRKSGGNEGTASRGSGALMSYVDVIIEFSRLEPDDPNNNQRKFITLSRFDQTPHEVILDYDGNEYSSQVVTNSREAKKHNKSKKVLGLIERLITNNIIERKFTTSDVHEHWDDSIGKRPVERTIRNYFEDLISMEKIEYSLEDRNVSKTKARLYKIIDGKNVLNPKDISVDTYDAFQEILANDALAEAK